MLFSTADDVNASLGRLLQELAADAEFAPRLMVLDTVLQFRFRNPDAIATLTLRGDDAPAVVLGPLPDGTTAPEIVVTLDADVAHALWRGRHNVAVGLARGTIQAKGETTRIVELLRLTDEIAPFYDQLLRTAGRDDLADAEAPAQTSAAASEGAAADGAAAEGSATDAAAGESAAADGSGDGGAEPAADTDDAAAEVAGDESAPAASAEDAAAGDAAADVRA